MRACPQCSRLIHDAAMVCRFCNELVSGHFAVAQGWEDFALRFSQLSKREQRDLWQDLSDDDRSYAQKALGVEPPERFEFTSMPGKQIEEAHRDLGETPRHLVDLSGAQLRRLLAGYIVLFLFSLGLVASVLLFRFVEVPGLASKSPLLSRATISKSLDRHATTASRKPAGLAAKTGLAAKSGLAEKE